MDNSFKIKVDDQFEFTLADLPELDAVATGENTFHILNNHKAYHTEVVGMDEGGKSYQLKINGKLYQVAIQDVYDLLVQRLGLSAVAEQKVKDIKAPMPGLVLKIEVEEGAEVHKGDTLVILEAMKMENVIKSPGQGVVKRIEVKQGQAVDKNQLLLEME